MKLVNIDLSDEASNIVHGSKVISSRINDCTYTLIGQRLYHQCGMIYIHGTNQIIDHVDFYINEKAVDKEKAVITFFQEATVLLLDEFECNNALFTYACDPRKPLSNRIIKILANHGFKLLDISHNDNSSNDLYTFICKA